MLISWLWEASPRPSAFGAHGANISEGEMHENGT